MKITIFGLSITSAWGNGHATTYRGLVRELNKSGNEVIFFERDVPWYADNRDLMVPGYCKLILYKSIQELEDYKSVIKDSDLIIIGSYVVQGAELIDFIFKNFNCIKAFYDIDTPVTLSKLNKKDFEYLNPEQIKDFDLYLSFSGGKSLEILEKKYYAQAAKTLYCSFDPEIHFPQSIPHKWILGYIGTYSIDRQPPLKQLMLDATNILLNNKFVVAGPGYPADILWPQNVERIEHLSPDQHNQFYNSQKFTLNITREDMVALGHSPSVRLFEAAACSTPVISDNWVGLDELFTPGEEILISHNTEDTIYYLRNIDEHEAKEIGNRARKKVLNNHTAAHRAEELLSYYNELVSI